MGKKNALALSFLLLLILTLAIAPYTSGEPGDVRNEPGGVGALGVSDPPPPGYFVRYMFTGARDNLGTSAATSVHCTNFGSSSVTVMVEISDFDNNPTVSGSISISPSFTRTFSTANTAVYAEDVTLTNPGTDEIDQGSGRIMVNDSTAKIICTAQVLDPVNNPPEFIVNLDLFRR